jgi:hypothetical protein
MAERRIKLERSAPQKVNFDKYSAYRMRIDVTEVEGEDLDQYIFIYQRRQASPYTGDNCDPFCAVAGPQQLADIPPVEPDQDRHWPFYRLDYVELDFPSTTQAFQAWELIKLETCILVEAMGKFTQLAVEEEFWCPGPPDDGGTGSQSESESISEP